MNTERRSSSHQCSFPLGLIFSIILFTAIISGCGGSDDTDNGQTPETINDPVKTLSEAYEEYRQVIGNMADGTEDFILQKGLSAFAIGSFLKNYALEYESHAAVDPSEFGFDSISYDFRTHTSSNYTESSPSMASLPAMAIAQDEVKHVNSAYTIKYDLTIQNIVLTRLSDPNDLIERERDNIGAANQLVYGVYTAEVRIEMRVTNNRDEVLERDESFLNRMLNQGDNIQKSESVSIENGYVIESIVPAQIGFLVRKIEPPVYTPSGLKAGQTSADTIHLEWNAVPEASEYRIFWSETSGIDIDDELTYIEEIPLEKNTYDDFTGEPGTIYYFRVASITNGRISRPGVEISVTIEPIIIPTNIQVSLHENDSLKITWNEVSNADGYRVYWSNLQQIDIGNDDTYQECIPESLNQSEIPIEEEMTYYFMVTSVVNQWESKPSIIVCVTINSDDGIELIYIPGGEKISVGNYEEIIVAGLAGSTDIQKYVELPLDYVLTGIGVQSVWWGWPTIILEGRPINANGTLGERKTFGDVNNNPEPWVEVPEDKNYVIVGIGVARRFRKEAEFIIWNHKNYVEVTALHIWYREFDPVNRKLTGDVRHESWGAANWEAKFLPEGYGLDTDHAIITGVGMGLKKESSAYGGLQIEVGYIN